jgi:hypothetical protein
MKLVPYTFAISLSSGLEIFTPGPQEVNPLVHPEFAAPIGLAEFVAHFFEEDGEKEKKFEADITARVPPNAQEIFFDTFIGRGKCDTCQSKVICCWSICRRLLTIVHTKIDRQGEDRLRHFIYSPRFAHARALDDGYEVGITTFCAIRVCHLDSVQKTIFSLAEIVLLPCSLRCCTTVCQHNVRFCQVRRARLSLRFISQEGQRLAILDRIYVLCDEVVLKLALNENDAGKERADQPVQRRGAWETYDAPSMHREQKSPNLVFVQGSEGDHGHEGCMRR